MTYREQRPATAWSRWIECGWCSETEDEPRGFAVRPDACVDIVYSDREGLRVVGTMTTEQHFHFPPGMRIAGVRFHPGMAGTFLGASPSEVTDSGIALEDVWGKRARDLEQRLREARSPGETMRLLLENIPAPSAEPNPVQRAIAAITAGHGACDLDEAALHANLSLRQFRRRCLEESGLAPKHLSRVLRFRYACRLAERSAVRDWPDIAAQAGYFDQAHLIRDFHEFAGRAPTQVFSSSPGLER